MNTFRYIYYYIKQKIKQNLLKRKASKLSRVFYIFNNFDAHFKIKNISSIEHSNTYFYDFYVKKEQYRIVVENNDLKIKVQILKYNNSCIWEIQGIDKNLSYKETQKIFGTILYIIKTNYNNVIYAKFKTIDHTQFNFRSYINCLRSMSNLIFNNPIVSHNDKDEVNIYIKNK